jgi:hypothetical protein
LQPWYDTTGAKIISTTKNFLIRRPIISIFSYTFSSIKRTK